MNPGYECVVVSATLTALAVSFVALRLISRVFLVKNLGIDDGFSVAAIAFSVGFLILIIIQYQHGMGIHIKNVAQKDYAKMMEAFWLSVGIYNIAMTCAKLSVILQYLRFVVEKKHRMLCWALLSFCALYGIALTPVSFVPCKPIAYFWDHTIPGGHCINLKAFWFFMASVNIITDILVVAFPILILRGLNLPRMQKYALILVFAMGGFTCITSFIRLRSIYDAAETDDITFVQAPAAKWSSVELNTAIICACLATLRPVFARVFPLLRNNSTRGVESAPVNLVPSSEHSSRTPSDLRQYDQFSDLTSDLDTTNHRKIHENPKITIQIYSQDV